MKAPSDMVKSSRIAMQIAIQGDLTMSDWDLTMLDWDLTGEGPIRHG